MSGNESLQTLCYQAVGVATYPSNPDTSAICSEQATGAITAVLTDGRMAQMREKVS